MAPIYHPIASICAFPDGACRSLCPNDVGISGADDRERVVDVTSTPHKWICSLFPFYSHPLIPGFVWSFAAGSGFLVSERHVVTAGHVLHDQVLINNIEGSPP